MTRKEIEALIHLLPPEAPYLTHRRNRFVSYDNSEPHLQRAETRAIALNDPRFGWQFVCTFRELKRRIPCSAVHESTQRAWHWLNGGWDEEMDDVMLTDHPNSQFARNLIQALLLMPKVPFSKISEILCISEKAVALYDHLFFNVRERSNEQVYIGSLVYPEHRRVELITNYMFEESVAILLKRIAVNEDLDTLLEFAGVKHGLKEIDCAAAAKRLESMVVNNGLRQMRWGLMNDAKAPGIKAALRVVAAQNARANNERDAEETMGLGALSAGESIMETVKQLQSKDILERRLLQRVMAKADQDSKQHLAKN